MHFILDVAFRENKMLEVKRSRVKKISAQSSDSILSYSYTFIVV
jgi:hypothetical protein